MAETRDRTHDAAPDRVGEIADGPDREEAGGEGMPSGCAIASVGCLTMLLCVLLAIAVSTPFYVIRWTTEISFDELLGEAMDISAPARAQLGEPVLTGYPSETNNCGKAVRAEWDEIAWRDADRGYEMLVEAAISAGFSRRWEDTGTSTGFRKAHSYFEKRVGRGYRYFEVNKFGPVDGLAELGISARSNCYPGFMLPLYT